jgi:flagellar basal-body rod modification protein FlgD
MAIAPISSAGGLTSAASNLRLDDLLSVLLTELTHQNPFKPVDNKDFMGQIVQFASLDSSQRLNQSIDQLLALQAMNQSVGLIGKRVSARVEGQTITGTVRFLTMTGGVPRMTIETSSGVIPNIAIGQLETVGEVPR